jgi:hypothetical protein
MREVGLRSVALALQKSGHGVRRPVVRGAELLRRVWVVRFFFGVDPELERVDFAKLKRPGGIDRRLLVALRRKMRGEGKAKQNGKDNPGNETHFEVLRDGFLERSTRRRIGS